MIDDAGGTTDARPDLADLERLVLSAFEMTRSAGRKDWTVMTVPVLKSRLLVLTGREFSESSFGAGSMPELVGLLPDLLEIDSSARPPRVRLRNRGTAPVPRERYQIRRDLWNAVVDFGRGERYVWTGEAAVPESAHRDPAADAKVLPTLTREEEMAWRATFLGRVAPQVDAGERERVYAWLERQLSTRVLPVEIQGQWSDYLKARVLDRLRQWFHGHDLPEPADLFGAGPPRTPECADGSALEELRALVVRCVHNMTWEELSELQLPARALLWARR